MNKNRRKRIEDAVSSLMDLRDELESICEEEQESFDNLPESLQSSEKGETMEYNISVLEDSYNDIDSIIDNLNEL